MFPHMYKVRPRSSAERSSVDEGKPEWAGRRSSGKWPPAPEQQEGGLKQSPSSGSMAACPPPIPAPPPDGQDDLARSGSPALQPSTPPRPAQPRTRPVREEESSLKVPEGGKGLRSRSASPNEVWGTPEEHLSADPRIRSSPSSATASPRVRRRWPPSETGPSGSLSDLRHRDASPASDSEVRKWAPLPPRPRTRGPPSNTGSVGDLSNSHMPPEAFSQNVEQKMDSVTLPRESSQNNVEEVKEPLPEFLEPVREPLPDTFEPGKMESTVREPLPEFLNTSDNDDDSKEPIPETLEGSTNDLPGTSVPTAQAEEIMAKAHPEIINVLQGKQEDIEEPKHTTTDTPAPVVEEPEVSNEWKDLLGDALSSHVLDYGDDPSGDPSLDLSTNAFFKAEAPPPELFQGSSVSYIPASKQEFLEKQREEDQKYILSALDREEAELRQPEPKPQRPDPEAGAAPRGTGGLKASSDADRPWSPGPPIFKKDIERHRQQAPRDDSSNKTVGELWWQDQDSDFEGYESDGSVPQAPPPPPGSVPPPPPKPFGNKVDPSAAMPKIRKGHLDTIKKAVRTTRPDWHALMKNLEQGVKLKHVKDINDRSQPILPGSRGKNGKFVYESEKPTIVNELLHEIQRGVKLRRVRTDDRSKPDFSKLGLKKFRRQITVEEKKKVKPEDPETLPSSSDDEEDIDNMRDDLEATKTQLADEIKKSQKLEREKKVMKIDIEALHAEIRKLKRQLKEVGIEDKPMVNGEEGIMPKLTKSMSKLRMSEKEAVDIGELDTIEAEIKELNGQIESQKMRANAFENKAFELEEKLKVANTTADEWEGRAIFFEKKFKALQKDQSIELPDIGIVGTQTDPVDILMSENKEQYHPVNALDGFGAAARKSGSRRSFASQINRMESFQEVSDEETPSSSEVESEEEEDDEDADDDQTIAEEDDGLTEEEREARRVKNEEKRLKRDVVFWANKLEHMKAKEANVLKERNNLRDRIKKFYRDMYQERVDYLKSKNELDELVRQLKDPEELAEEEEDDGEEEEEEEPHDDEPGWWFDKPNLKPKKLKKKNVKRLNADGEEEDEEDEDEEEDLEDLTQLEEPCWSDSEGEESDPDDENDSLQVRINFLQTRTKNHENSMNAVRKDNYLLKTEVDTCKEKYNAERLRRRRLEEELNLLVSDMQ